MSSSGGTADDAAEGSSHESNPIAPEAGPRAERSASDRAGAASATEETPEGPDGPAPEVGSPEAAPVSVADEPRAASEDPGGSGAPSAAPRRATKPPESRDDREIRLGWPALLMGLYALLSPALVLAAFSPYAVRFLAGEGSPPSWAPALILGVDAALSLAFATILLWRVTRVATGTTGRARLFLLGCGAVSRAIGEAILAGVLAFALTDPNALTVGFGPASSGAPMGELALLWDSLSLVTRAQSTFGAGVAGLVLLGLGLLAERAALLGCWFLLPARFRFAFWLVADTALTIAFTAVMLLFPWQPSPDTPDAVLFPAIKLTVVSLAATRVLFRLFPRLLDLIEGFVTPGWTARALPFLSAVFRRGFRRLLAARMLRARKSGFLTAIGALAIFSVTFSSCTLTLTLSVMGGFRNDLKRKLLGNNAHVVVDREHGTFEGWDPTLESIRGADGVIAATPYVQGEVMITSATNLAGAVIRGIDPETIGTVTDLPRNMRHGRLEYLQDPQRLMRLRPDEMGGGLLNPTSPPPRPPMEDDGSRGSVFGDADELLDQAGPPPPELTGGSTTEDQHRARIERDIGEFLLPEGDSGEPDDVAAAATDPPSISDEELRLATRGGAPRDRDRSPGNDLLPGLIVGQELARTLRLHVGDEVNVVSPRGDLAERPMPRTRPFRIAGIFYSGMYEFDMKMAYTTLEAAQGFLNVGDAITGIEVKVDDTDRAEEIATAIEGLITRTELRVRAWQEVNRNLFGALQLEKLAMFITLGIAILVSSFCVVGTLMLLVQEKGKEVGILKAMGATGSQVVAIFMAQGLMIGLLGAGLGLGLGYVVCWGMEHFGVHLDPEVYYIDKLPVHTDATEFALTGLATVLVCLLATIYPAILGSRLRPMDALRYS